MNGKIALKIVAVLLIIATLCLGFVVVKTYQENIRVEEEAKKRKIAAMEKQKEQQEGGNEEARNQEKRAEEEIRQETTEEMSEVGEMLSYRKEDLYFIQNKYKKYTYRKMQNDIDILQSLYADKLEVSILTTTADSRNVYDIAVGKKESANQYIVTGSIHAREYITTKLVMMLMVDLLDSMDGSEDFLIHFVPMVNPDGVSISQLGTKGILTDAVRSQVAQIAQNDGNSIENREYLRQWKSNANGVDLNRNFDAKWDEYYGTGYPSSGRYKGSFPGSENEAAALISLTQNYPIKKTISYHTKGNVIYWYFAQTGELLDETERFANAISNSTGYMTDANFENLDPAGYKDWALCQMEIPSITIEVGSGETPVSEEQIDGIYERNKNVLNILLEP